MKKILLLVLLSTSCLPVFAQKEGFIKVRQIGVEGFYFTPNAGVFELDAAPHRFELSSTTMLDFSTRFSELFSYRLQAGVSMLRSDLDSWQKTIIAPSVGAFFGMIQGNRSDGRITVCEDIGDIVIFASDLGGRRMINVFSISIRPTFYLTSRLGIAATLRMPLIFDLSKNEYSSNPHYQTLLNKLPARQGARKLQLGIGLMYQL